MPSQPGEQQVGQQEPHGEATRDSDQSGCGQGSQLRASRMILASRRHLPKLPLPLEWRQAGRPPLSRRRQCARPLTSDVVHVGTKISYSVGSLSWQKRRTARARHAQRKQRMCGIRVQASPLTPQPTVRKHLCHHNDLLKSVSLPPLPRSLLQSPRTVCRLQPLIEKALPVQSLSRHRQDLLWSVKRADPR